MEEGAGLHISMGGVLPPFWLALFDATHFFTSVETTEWALLSSDRIEAVTRLRRREEHLLTVFGEQAAGVLRALAAKLAQLESDMLILETSDMGIQFCHTPAQWQKELQLMLSAFESPPEVPSTWQQRLFGAAVMTHNAGWHAFFKRFDGIKKLAASRKMSPQQLAGGTIEENMPWERLDTQR